MKCSSTGKTYVAIVDDDESLCRSTARLLAAAGYHPVTYASGEAFLADADKPSFGCLLLDRQLGGMSGLELENRLARRGSATPVIFLTAHDEPTAIDQLAGERGARVMHKSDTGDHLLVAVRQAVDEYRVRVAPPTDLRTP